MEHYIAEYERCYEPQVVSFRDKCPWIKGTDRYTHLIHRYTAKLLPHIPAFFLTSSICPSHATILDPFAGSGTVLLEGMLQGHRSMGVEINPIAKGRIVAITIKAMAIRIAFLTVEPNKKMPTSVDTPIEKEMGIFRAMKTRKTTITMIPNTTCISLILFS